MSIKLLRDTKKIYGLELVGEGLGNLHIYFDMDGADSEIYAVESLYLLENLHRYLRTN